METIDLLLGGSRIPLHRRIDFRDTMTDTRVKRRLLAQATIRISFLAAVTIVGPMIVHQTKIDQMVERIDASFGLTSAIPGGSGLRISLIQFG